MRTNRSVPAGIAVLLGAVAILSVLLPALHAQHSSAAGTTPSWEPDSNSAAPYGNLVFYDSNGNVVTSGTDLNHLFDYSAATTAGDSGATKATLYFAAPNHALSTGQWAVNQQSASHNFPNSSAPAPLTGPGFTNPVDSLGATEADLTAALGALAPDSTSGYANLIQVRMKDSGAGGVTSGSSYWSSDIAYNTGASSITVDGVTVPAGGWAQVYPGVVSKTATTTAISTTASSSVSAGTPVTYTAKVTPTPGAGTVAFNDGPGNQATTSCSQQPVDATGTATCTVTYTVNDTYTVNASYGGDATFAGSASSSPVTVTVTGGTTRTATTTTLSPTTSAAAGSPVTYTATVTPAPNGGTVAFSDGSGNPATSTCASQTITAGVATCTVTYPAAGSFTITAAYSGSTGFGGSTATSETQTITNPPAAPTSTVVTSDSNGSSVVGQPVVYTAAVSATGSGAGTPTGTVTFNDGSHSAICTAVALDGTGKATCQQTPTQAATATITAVYANTDGKFAGSTSPAFSQLVKPAATSIAVTSSANPGIVGTELTLTATVTVTSPGSGTPTGTVDFSDGTGNPASKCTGEALTAGTATSTATATCSVTYTAAGSDPVDATYKNTDGNFSGSTTSSPLAETVQASSSLPGAPGGPQATAGDGQVTLSWTAPTTNGSAVTGYNVFQGTTAGAEATTPVNSTPITGTTDTVTGLTNGARYYFTIEAVSPGGSSPASSEVSATPAASSGTTTTSTTTAQSTPQTSTASSDPASTGSSTGSSTGGATDSSSQSGGRLPFTGAETTATVALALLMLVAGVFLVAMARNRKKLGRDR